MARIKIEDLPVMEDISEKELKGIFGGGVVVEDKPWSRRGLRRGRFGGFSQRGIVIVNNKPGGLGQRGIIIINNKPVGKMAGGQKGFTNRLSLRTTLAFRVACCLRSVQVSESTVFQARTNLRKSRIVGMHRSSIARV